MICYIEVPFNEGLTVVILDFSYELNYYKLMIYSAEQREQTFFRKWPFSGGDDRGKTSSRALVFTRCDIQSERL